MAVVMAELDASAEFVERLSARMNALVSEGFSPRDSARRVVLEFESYKQQSGGVHALLADAVFMCRMSTGEIDDLIGPTKCWKSIYFDKRWVRRGRSPITLRSKTGNFGIRLTHG